MLIKNITYTDFNGNETTEVLYFSLSRRELVQLDSKYPDGFEKYVQTLRETDNKGEILALFENIVFMSYGKKSEDGKYFVKKPDDLENFKSSAACEALFDELMDNPQTSEAFIKGIIPANLSVAMMPAA